MVEVLQDKNKSSAMAELFNINNLKKEF